MHIVHTNKWEVIKRKLKIFARNFIKQCAFIFLMCDFIFLNNNLAYIKLKLWTSTFLSSANSLDGPLGGLYYSCLDHLGR